MRAIREEADVTTSDLSSIPKLLERNIRAHGHRPAYREKEYGIWQSWTWAEAGAEIEALPWGFWTSG